MAETRTRPEAENRDSRIPHTRIWGLRLALVTAVISGVAVAINGFGVRAWSEVGGPGPYTTAKNLVAALILLSVLTVLTARRSADGFRAPRQASGWLGLGVIGLVGGSVPFLLFFEGLAQAESVNAAFIHKTLVVWVAALALAILRERIRWFHTAAIGVLILGQVMLAGGVSGLVWGTGEAMILAATLLWAVEVVVAKQILPQTTSMTLGVARMGLGSLVLVVFGVATGSFASLGELTATQVGWVLLTGAVLSLYVMSWFAALTRAGAIDVTAVLVLGAVITALIRTGFQDVALPSPVGLVLLVMGVAVFTVPRRRWVGG